MDSEVRSAPWLGAGDAAAQCTLHDLFPPVIRLQDHHERVQIERTQQAAFSFGSTARPRRERCGSGHVARAVLLGGSQSSTSETGGPKDLHASLAARDSLSHLLRVLDHGPPARGHRRPAGNGAWGAILSAPSSSTSSATLSQGFRREAARGDRASSAGRAHRFRARLSARQATWSTLAGPLVSLLAGGALFVARRALISAPTAVSRDVGEPRLGRAQSSFRSCHSRRPPSHGSIRKEVPDGGPSRILRDHAAVITVGVVLSETSASRSSSRASTFCRLSSWASSTNKSHDRRRCSARQSPMAVVQQRYAEAIRKQRRRSVRLATSIPATPP